MLFVAMAVAVTIFSVWFLFFNLLLDRMWEKVGTNLREELLKAQIKTTLQSVIANDALICGGQNDTTALTAFLWTERALLVQYQLCLVFNLGGGGTIFVDFG